MADRLPDDARRIALAVARAVLPPSARLGGGDDATIERLEGVLTGAGPKGVSGYASLLRALERLTHATGRPGAETAAALERWADADLVRRGLALAVTGPLKMAHFDAPEPHRALGATWRFGAVREEPRWMAQVTPGSDLDADVDVECDVVVVGTGAGGGVMAKELADAGLAVVMVEEGDYHLRGDFTGGGMESIRRFYRDAGMTGSVGNAVIPIPMGALVGGSTAVNTGTCWRTPDWVLSSWADDLGLAALAPGPMAPYFERVEQTLQVERAGAAVLGGVATVVARGADALGYSHRALDRNAPGCDGSGICDLGCPTGARRSTDVSYVPPALERGAGLFTGVAVERVLVEDDVAVGVEGRSTTTGQRLRVRARATVLACGSIPTPVLLQRQGLGGPHAGRHLSIHPATTVSALFDEEIRGFAAIPQGYCVDQFHRDGILFLGASVPVDMAAAQFGFTGERLMRIMDAYDRVASMGVMVSDRPRGRVRPGPGGRPLVTYWLGRQENDRLQRGTEIMARIFMAAGATEVYPALRRHRLVRDPADLRRLASARVRAADWLLTAFHPLGTCRMAPSPDRGVVGPDHQVFGTEGLYVADGSVVPGAPAVNPQVTIMALATRAADLLAARLSERAPLSVKSPTLEVVE